MERLKVVQRVWVKEPERVQGRKGVLVSQARGPRSYRVEIGADDSRRSANICKGWRMA